MRLNTRSYSHYTTFCMCFKYGHGTIVRWWCPLPHISIFYRIYHFVYMLLSLLLALYYYTYYYVAYLNSFAKFAIYSPVSIFFSLFRSLPFRLSSFGALMSRIYTTRALTQRQISHRNIPTWNDLERFFVVVVVVQSVFFSFFVHHNGPSACVWVI